MTGAVLVSTIVPRDANAEKNPLRILSSPLTPEQLDRDKRTAIESLRASIPTSPEAEYLRSYARLLPLESQMYIPPLDELKSVVQKCEGDLMKLTTNIRVGDTGIFVLGDAQDDRHIQRLYTVRKKTGAELQFLKGYSISMARKGYGKENDSNKTPTDLHWIHNGTRGYFGEVVSGLNKHRDSFRRISVDGKDRWFVNGFGTESENDVAEVVTDQYLLIGPETSSARGIRIHGTNRSGSLKPDGTWESFLDGKKRSTGCIRMSNTDVRDISLSIAKDINETPSEESRVFVMIHATPAAQELSRRDTIDFRQWFLGKK